MNSVLIHRATDSKEASCLLALPLHKQIPLTDKVVRDEAIDVLNWLAENLPGSVYEIVVEKLKAK